MNTSGTVKLSIIMPVKDRAANTKKLVEDLCRQNHYFNAEIIVVENGSTEDMSFLDDYDIVLRHETQVGVSHARNVALDICTGDYICFVDNDDTISGDYLYQIYKHIGSGKDWYVWNFRCDGNLCKIKNPKDPLKSNWALWGYCFKRKLFDGVRFDENKKAGSDLITFDIIKGNGEYIDAYLYDFKWLGNDDSLSHLYNAGKL